MSILYVYWRNHEHTFNTAVEGDYIVDHDGIKGTPGIIFITLNGKVLKVAHFSEPDQPSLEEFAHHYL